jgi:predicted AAA+ superfamily ATPase
MFQRHLNTVLRSRLLEERGPLQVVQGPRQVGKTTSVLQVLEGIDIQSIYETADGPEMQDRQWIHDRWARARKAHSDSGRPVILALDEVQKVPLWSDVVKQLYDEDTRHRRDIRVVLLGSSPLLLGRGLSESLTGRFEVIPARHWTWPEMRDAFGWDLDTFIYFGGHPGSARYIEDESRWRQYVKDSIIETTLSRDLLHMTRVDKPAALRRLLYVAAEYSGRELSYRKLVEGLDDVGNATTVAHYLHLLSEAGLVTALQKFAGEAFRRRASTPKLQVHSTGLMSAMGSLTFAEARADGASWGRLVESCVGAHLISFPAPTIEHELYYWRDRGNEVDFVLRSGRRLLAIEVKSGAATSRPKGLDVFAERFGGDITTLVVGSGGVPLQEFLESEIVRMETGSSVKPARESLRGIDTDVPRERDRL